jgi:DNA polymerase
MRRYYKLGHLDVRWIDQYCMGDWKQCVRYKMESAGTPHPDWMLPDGQLDERLRRL